MAINEDNLQLDKIVTEKLSKCVIQNGFNAIHTRDNSSDRIVYQALPVCSVNRRYLYRY